MRQNVTISSTGLTLSPVVKRGATVVRDTGFKARLYNFWSLGP